MNTQARTLHDLTAWGSKVVISVGFSGAKKTNRIGIIANNSFSLMDIANGRHLLGMSNYCKQQRKVNECRICGEFKSMAYMRNEFLCIKCNSAQVRNSRKAAA